MPDKHHRRWGQCFEQGRHLGHVGFKADIMRHFVRAFGQSGKRRRVNLVSLRAQQISNRLPAPAAMPAAVDQDKSCRSHSYSAAIDWAAWLSAGRISITHRTERRIGSIPSCGLPGGM